MTTRVIRSFDQIGRFCVLMTLTGAVSQLGLARHASGDVPIDSTTRIELQQWSQLYWTYVETGQPGDNAAQFRFADSRFNTPLLSPVRGAIRSLQKLRPQLRTAPNDGSLGSAGAAAPGMTFENSCCMPEFELTWQPTWRPRLRSSSWSMRTVIRQH